MADVERTHWWFVGKRDLVRRLVERHCGVGELRILDAGCGAGQTLVDLAGCGAGVGTDFEWSAVEFTRRRGIACVARADCQRPPFADDRFDLIVLLDTLEHVADDVGSLRRLGRTLRPQGRLVVTVPAHPWLFGRHDVALGHRRRYSRRRLARAVRRAGLRVRQMTGYNTLLFPVVAPWRLMTRAARAVPPRSDVTIRWPGWLNKALAGLMALDSRLNVRGPLGPSLSLVAVVEKDEARSTNDEG